MPQILLNMLFWKINLIKMMKIFICEKVLFVASGNEQNVKNTILIYLIDTDYLYDNAHHYGYLCHFLSKILFIYHKETGHCFAAPATIQQWNFISFLVNLNSILLLVCRVSCLSLRPTFFIIKNEAFQLKANEARNDFKGRALIKHFIACRHCCFG